MAPSLRFSPEGRFRIVQFTDTHFRDGDAADRRTAGLIEAVIEDEQPDLVVLTGDVVEGSTPPIRPLRGGWPLLPSRAARCPGLRSSGTTTMRGDWTGRV